MPGAPPDLFAKVTMIEAELDQIIWTFQGQPARASQEENWPAPPSLNDRLSAVMAPHWSSTSAVTQTQIDQYNLLAEEFPPILEKLKTIADVDLRAVEEELDRIGAPWTPGRIPSWNK
jgi:hypothetical protein